MLKTYKKIIVIGKPDPDRSTQAAHAKARYANLLTMPALLAGAVAGTLFLSAFIAFLLVPVGIVAAGAWWRLRKLRDAPAAEPSLEAEYTVIKDPSKK